MSWGNSSNDPNTDERVLKDAQRTIERIVEAMRNGLDDELAVQQMEYDQLFGVNSMQFAMYQTLVMTFFQDHQMLASLNLKRTRPDLSQGVPEQKRAYLMEVIAERVSSAGPANAAQQPFIQNQNIGAGLPGQDSVVQSSAAWAQNSQPPAPAPAPVPTANWLDPQPAAAAQPAPGDWLNQSSSKERPPSTAWPTANEDSSAWTLKPGSGQPPVIPTTPAAAINGGNGAPWTAASNSWPTPDNAQPGGSGGWPAVPEQPQAPAQPDTPWPGAQTGAPGWADQANAKQPPAAAWPASNNGAIPAANNGIDLPSAPVAPPGVAQPQLSSPIGEIGQSGTWTLPPGGVAFTKPGSGGQPPAPAWDGNKSAGAAPPAAAWTEPSGTMPAQPDANNNGNYGNEISQQGGSSGQPPEPAWAASGAPSQEMAAWNQQTPGSPAAAGAVAPPAPAWSAPASGAMPVPDLTPNQGAQPWQAPSMSSAAQPWQPGAAPQQPAWQAPPASLTQPNAPGPAAPAPPAWEVPPPSVTQSQMPAQPQQPPQQPWQQPAASTEQWQQPAPAPLPTMPWQQPAPAHVPQQQTQQPQTQAQQQPWETPGTAGGAPSWANQAGQSGGQQPFAAQPAPVAPQPPAMPPMPQMPQMPQLPSGQPTQSQQGWTPPDSPWGGAEGNGAPAPWSAQNPVPPQAGAAPMGAQPANAPLIGAPPTSYQNAQAQYQGNNGQPDQYPNPQGQYPTNGQGQMPPQGYQQPPGSTEDLSINFAQNNQQPQNVGGTLSGVLRQMRNNDQNNRKQDEDERKENYNPNTAW
ncbi:MAG: hypothetical protein SGJ27_15655 [Candidatus Melainabacteria bacterium]|nr:hypothetical protein [Candidatus Melainabacteria bacterium]